MTDPIDLRRPLHPVLVGDDPRRDLRVRFFGVRGSIPTAGDDTRRYGGNTSCVALWAGEQLVVFDAGTGLRRLGAELLGGNVPGAGRIHLFLSHLHWDHIQGFPFFGPAYLPDRRIEVHRVRADATAPSVREVFASQMRAPTFPVELDALRAELRFHDHTADEELLIGRALVRSAMVDHPNGCAAYRVDFDGRSVVYATDIEHGAEPDPALVELARGADLLIYDAMYTPEEYAGVGGPSRRGWGHSTFEAGAELAELAGVRHLCLFHHDPAHDDDFMDRLGERARARFADTLVAREDLELRV